MIVLPLNYFEISDNVINIVFAAWLTWFPSYSYSLEDLITVGI